MICSFPGCLREDVYAFRPYEGIKLSVPVCNYHRQEAESDKFIAEYFRFLIVKNHANKDGQWTPEMDRLKKKFVIKSFVKEVDKIEDGEWRKERKNNRRYKPISRGQEVLEKCVADNRAGYWIPNCFL